MVGGEGQWKVLSWVGEEMKKERDMGMVLFNLWMVVLVIFKIDGWLVWERGFKVFCGKLKVVFEGGLGNGVVLLFKFFFCLVYV